MGGGASFHPLRAPLRFNPQGTSICRFENYMEGRCKKQELCPFDHAHCHVCLEEGHRAWNCEVWVRNHPR